MSAEDDTDIDAGDILELAWRGNAGWRHVSGAMDGSISTVLGTLVVPVFRRRRPGPDQNQGISTKVFRQSTPDGREHVIVLDAISGHRKRRGYGRYIQRRQSYRPGVRSSLPSH